MAIVRNPTEVNLAQLYTSFARDPAVAIGLAAGNTEPPAGYTVPTYTITVLQNTAASGQQIRGAYYSKLGIPPVAPSPPPFTSRIATGIAAAEGNNRALYLNTGIYETNYTMYLGFKLGQAKIGIHSSASVVAY